jgi:hypothetical protein
MLLSPAVAKTLRFVSAVRAAVFRGVASSSHQLPLEDGHPVIDLAPLEREPGAEGASLDDRNAVVAHLWNALVNHGHFYAKTSVLSEE